MSLEIKWHKGVIDWPQKYGNMQGNMKEDFYFYFYFFEGKKEDVKPRDYQNGNIIFFFEQ